MIGLGLLLCVLAAPGCFRAKLETGLPKSDRRVEREFASGFLGGLFGPAPMDVHADCPHGVASFETQRSFLNELVRVLTFTYYSPMQMRVTCAAPTTAETRP